MKPLLVILALVAAAPLQAQPDDPYRAAVAERHAGRPRVAVELLDQWLEKHPNDSDALIQRGYAWLALEESAKAALDFRAALALAPGDADARDGLALAERAAVMRREGEFILAEGAWSRLAPGSRDWWELALDGQTTVSDTVSLGARAGWFRRFGEEDVELVGRVIAHPSDDLWLRASAGGTPSADFRPEVELAVGADYRVGQGANPTVLTFDTGFQRFPSQDVVTINPGLVQYLGKGRFWITARGIAAVADGGRLRLGGIGRVDFAPQDRERYYFGLANGPETELGIVSRVTAIFAGTELPVSRTLSLLPSILHEWRPGDATRTEFRLGLKIGS